MSDLRYALAMAAFTSSLALGCGQNTTPQALRNLDRPSEISFACFGDLNVDGTAVTSAQPLSSCAAHLRGETPEGQEGVVPPDFFAFVLQPALGTVAVVNVRALGIQDNDQLTPGLNDIPVGTLPVGMAEDQSGCFVMTANSGSCDLASIDATSALDLARVAEVNRVAITTPAGDPLLTRPRSIAAGPQTDIIGEICPLEAAGMIYITYPDCNLVAVVEAASGEIQSALAFRDTGIVEAATDADFAACPIQCGDGVINVAHGTEPEIIEEKPVALEVSPDGGSLYITSETSPFFTIIELDEDGLPTTVIRRIRVAPGAEGEEVGLRNFAISERIDMGGDLHDSVVFPIGEFQFVYAIATDSTIRVIDIEHSQECDTQVDPRYLADETDVEFLSCMPVGDLRTPQRRLGAAGPGIQLPGRRSQGRNGQTALAMPLDIAFSTSTDPESPPVQADPNSMIGSFAFVTAASGQVFIINVDDDGYADTRNSEQPLAATLPLALPHQLRDDIATRGAVSENCSSPPTDAAGARTGSAPSQIIDLAAIANSKIHEMPFFRGQRCQGDDGLGNPIDTIVTELSFAADLATRDAAYPDLRAVEDQAWSIAWEGTHSLDPWNVAIDGPVVRKGVVARDGARVLLQDAGSPFCSLGIETYDIVALVGCNPLLEDAQCGIGESCYVHADTTAAVQSGVCLPADEADALSGTCRDFLTSRRRYSVASSSQGELELVERRRMLRTTPLDGCESATQCEELALLEPLLARDDHPIEAAIPEPLREFSWVCEADPGRVPGVDRCQMACESAEDCEDGFTCSGQRCVEAILPPAACIGAVQRYQTQIGEAFAVIGEDDGYASALVAAPDTGACIRPATASPLQVARIPLRPEPCDDDGDFMTGPNPCQTTIGHDEDYVPYVVQDGICITQDVAPRARETTAVRFANGALRFHLVDTETKGDLECRGDQAGEGPAFATPFAGYQIIFQVIGGFFPKTVPSLSAALPTRVVPGPAGNLWILDQGDSSSLDHGRIIRINPTEPGAFDPTVIQ
ncbi:MAG: hypothetical protein GY811_20300 [Myxococcales bacterium]|nr:hypothetical protein [Myxococcales bacterium]